MNDTHANYLGDLRYELRELHEEAKATMRTGTGTSIDRAFAEGQLMAYHEVRALIEQPTWENPNYLFDLGFALREAGERATRDAERAKRDVERSGDLDRMFHEGRQMTHYAVLTLMQQQAEAFGIPLADLALDGLDPDRDLS